MITLDMLEEVMEKAKVGYDKAKEALIEAGEDVEAAIENLLEKDNAKHKFNKAVEDTIAYVKDMAQNGLLSRIVISNKGETVVNIPLGIGVFGLVFGTFFTVAGLGAAFLAGYEVKVYTKDGSDIDLNAYMEKAKDKVSAAMKETKEAAMDEEFEIISDDLEEEE